MCKIANYKLCHICLSTCVSDHGGAGLETVSQSSMNDGLQFLGEGVGQSVRPCTPMNASPQPLGPAQNGLSQQEDRGMVPLPRYWRHRSTCKDPIGLACWDEVSRRSKHSSIPFSTLSNKPVAKCLVEAQNSILQGGRWEMGAQNLLIIGDRGRL